MVAVNRKRFVVAVVIVLVAVVVVLSLTLPFGGSHGGITPAP